MKHRIFDFQSKKDSSVYIGICEEERYFLRYDLPVDEPFLEEIFIEYDAIIPFEGTVLEADLYEQYKLLTGNGSSDENILDLVRNYLLEKHIEYIPYFDFTFDGKRIFTPLMFIAREDVVSGYFKFVAEIFENIGIKIKKENLEYISDKKTHEYKADKSVHESDAYENIYGHEQSILMPWDEQYDILAGWLFKVYIAANGIKSRSLFEDKINIEQVQMAQKKIDLVQKYVDTLLQEHISFRKEYGFDIPLADEMPDKDFGGKIPVWACWWQGMDSIPQMPAICLDSIKRNLPQCCELIVITLENCMEYVTFTPDIIDKFNQGIISYTHMSDILRAELLYRYGGMWIDTTYYVNGPIPAELFQEDFYTIAFGEKLWANDVMKGRWSLSLLITPPKHKAVQFLMEGLWMYWEKGMELIDYYLVDYVFEAGYKNFPEIKKAVDSSKLTSKHMFDLQLKMNQRIDALEKKWLQETSLFYKLNRKNEYFEYTKEGDLTFYGYMAKQAREHLGNDKEYSFIKDKRTSSKDMSMLEIEKSESQKENNMPEKENNSPRLIGNLNISEALEIIRRYNPSKICDYGMVFYQNSWINQGILKDMILHPFSITAVPNEEFDEKRFAKRVLEVLYDDVKAMTDGEDVKDLLINANNIIEEGNENIFDDLKMNKTGNNVLVNIVLMPEGSIYDLIICRKSV